MKNTDARRLTHSQLTDLRHRAVAAVQGGESPEVVARIFGVNRVSVYGWLARYRQGGWDGLNARKRGGRPPKLDDKAMKWIYRTVTLGDPRQFKFPFALWTSRMVAQLIHRRFGVALSRASVCRLLIQLGLSSQRPLWRAYQQDPAMVERWLREDFPLIQAEARKCGATIWFGDEAGVRSDAHAGTTWGVRGRTPIVSSTGARFGLNLISAVTRQGHFRFMCVKGKVNAKVFIGFLKRLLPGSQGPIFLVLDRHPSHRSASVARFVESVSARLKLFFLPPYSPELNPDEHVWNDLKNNALGRQSIAGPDQMKSSVLSHMRFLQKSPARVRAFFRAPTTAYAA